MLRAGCGAGWLICPACFLCFLRDGLYLEESYRLPPDSRGWRDGSSCVAWGPLSRVTWAPLFIQNRAEGSWVWLHLRLVWESQTRRGLEGLNFLSYLKLNKKGNLASPILSRFIAPKLALSETPCRFLPHPRALVTVINDFFYSRELQDCNKNLSIWSCCDASWQ